MSDATTSVIEAAKQQGRDEVIFGPCPEMKGKVPLVLYFATNKEADEFIDLVLSLKPGMNARRLS